MNTNKQVLKYREKIKEYQYKILEIQNKCEHPKVVKIPRASTGNYDPSADCYWYHCSCPDCGKIWTEDQ